MGKKNMNHLIPSMFLLNKHIWLWPSCNTHPKTLSFRATTHHFINPNNNNNNPLVPLELDPEVDFKTLGCSYFTNSSEYYSPSISTESDSVESIVRGARSHERLFFEPDSTSCSILEGKGSGRQCSSENSENGGGLPYKESVAVVMETEDPYDDFKKSMKEMVEIHELKDWDCLEELLGWYLRMNDEDNHEFIVGAFFDLLAGINSGRGGGGGGGGGGDGDGGVSVCCVDHSSASLTSPASTFSSPISSPNGN
ncbi:putative transcription factor OFP family [Helianthus annuus]|nr:putative transcription factor OFP family [Helianthus annuus]